MQHGKPCLPGAGFRAEVSAHRAHSGLFGYLRLLHDPPLLPREPGDHETGVQSPGEVCGLP